MSRLAVLALVAVCLVCGAQAGTITASTIMNGKNQVPDMVKTSATGAVSLKLNATHGELSIAITKIKTFTMVHIHGPADKASSGGVVVGLIPFIKSLPLALLNPPLTTTGKGSVQATIVFSGDDIKGFQGMADAKTAYAQFIQWLADGLLYVNVHTVEYPGGEIRGQLDCKAPCKL